MIYLWVFLLLALLGLLLYHGRGYASWVLTGALALAIWKWRGEVPWGWFVLPAVPFGMLVFLFGIPVLRARLLSSRIMKLLGKALPRMSATEREALEAGSVWFEAELFSGRPDWNQLLDLPAPQLSERERAFSDGPLDELCGMLDDWRINEEQDLPPEVWELLKKKRFFGMIIPEERGGLGFSALAQSHVITRVSARSVTGAVTVMVPNSLGPAELLLHYGTDEQKQRYLERLARGEEVPCFALTEPTAGSDAASIASEGIVCRDIFEGTEVLGVRLSWNKRYITLAPVATVLGLAFRLRDPDHLLGDEEDLGITLALIPPDLPGIDIGRRHDPLGVPFQNGPTVGKDVFVPLDAIIGGKEMAGQGWRMLMQCLAAGRAISLPSLACGAAQVAARTIGAYGLVREQFGLPIGAFEGIHERIARIGGLTYVMNSTRVLTAQAVDLGQKPAVVSAISKAYMTELMRQVVNDAMDVQAGNGICRGPRNILAAAYNAVPIGITVEGANILTRSLIIYGQGAIRCHPYIHEQMEAIANDDLLRFDRAFFGHVGFTARNSVRAILLGLTNGRLTASPAAGIAGGYFRQLGRYSAAFAALSDVVMALLGGSLKRREMISGRFADALAWMYIGSATLKRFIDDGSPERDLPLLRWGCEKSLYEVQTALLAITHNLPRPVLAWVVRRMIFPLGARRRPPSDRLARQVARSLVNDSELLEKLTPDIHIGPEDEPGLGQLEAARRKALRAQKVKDKVQEAVHSGKLDKRPRATLIARASKAGIIADEDRRLLDEAAAARNEVIQVDAFDVDSTPSVRRAVPAFTAEAK